MNGMGRCQGNIHSRQTIRLSGVSGKVISLTGDSSGILDFGRGLLSIFINLAATDRHERTLAAGVRSSLRPGRGADWEIGRLGDWENRPITDSQLPIPDSQLPIPHSLYRSMFLLLRFRRHFSFSRKISSRRPIGQTNFSLEAFSVHNSSQFNRTVLTDRCGFAATR